MDEYYQIMPREVLFICKNNVGRSQMAEGFWNAARGEDAAISAGVVDYRDHYEKPSDRVLQVMEEEGVDISHQVVKPLTDEMLESAGEIVIYCEPELLSPSLLQTAVPLTFHHIPDPEHMDLEGLRGVRDAVKQHVSSLLERRSVEENFSQFYPQE